MITPGKDGLDVYTDPSGNKFQCGLLPADKDTMSAAPQFKDTYEVIPISEWPKKGGPTLTDFMPFRWNQGNQNSCGGHGGGAAFTAAFNFQFSEAGKKVLEFSPTFLYGLVNGGRDNGCRPNQLMQALESTGICLRSTVGPGQIYKSSFPAAAFEEAKRFRADRQVVINTFEELGTAILKGHAVHSGIFCGNRFTPDMNGILPDWDGRKVGGHSTAQIGGLEFRQGRGWGAWTLNSWFPWGLDGWAWVPRSYFDGGLPDFSAIGIVSCRFDPKDDTPTPEPRS